MADNNEISLLKEENENLKKGKNIKDEQKDLILLKRKIQKKIHLNFMI